MIYCEDCKVASCYRCKLKNHIGHSSIDYAVYTSPKRKQQICDDVNKVKNMLANISSQSIEFDEKNSEVCHNFKETKNKIETRSTYLKDRIDDQTRMLLEELKNDEATELEKAEKVKKHHETITEKFQNFLQMSQCLVDGNSESSSLIHLAEDLKEQTEDLISQYESFKICQQMNFVNVAFEESDKNSTLGKISVHGQNTLEEKEADDDLKSHSLKTSPTPCQLEPIQPSHSVDAVSQPVLPQEFGIQQNGSENDSHINHNQSQSGPLPQASPDYFHSVSSWETASASSSEYMNSLTGKNLILSNIIITK